MTWTKAQHADYCRKRRQTETQVERAKRLEGLRRSVRKSKGANIDSTSRPMPDHCEACGGPPSLFRGGSYRFAWDHDHATGLFRGWLCSGCNSALGLLGDDLSRIDKLREYLNASRNISA